MTTSLRISGLGTALVVACGLLWLGCGGGHDAFQEVSSDECGACHEGEWNNTSQPNHRVLVAQGMTYTLEFCPQCHSTEEWRPPYNPALHPENLFPLTGELNGHNSNVVACRDCHDPTINERSSGGQNANCVGCHIAETGYEPHALPFMDDVHKDDPDYPLGGDRSVNFCLTCHTNGICEVCD